jgi:hypothetical protein
MLQKQSSCGAVELASEGVEELRLALGVKEGLAAEVRLHAADCVTGVCEPSGARICVECGRRLMGEASDEGWSAPQAGTGNGLAGNAINGDRVVGVNGDGGNADCLREGKELVEASFCLWRSGSVACFSVADEKDGQGVRAGEVEGLLPGLIMSKAGAAECDDERIPSPGFEGEGSAVGEMKLFRRRGREGKRDRSVDGPKHGLFAAGGCRRKMSEELSDREAAKEACEVVVGRGKKEVALLESDQEAGINGFPAESIAKCVRGQAGFNELSGALGNGAAAEHGAIEIPEAFR